MTLGHEVDTAAVRGVEAVTMLIRSRIFCDHNRAVLYVSAKQDASFDIISLHDQDVIRPVVLKLGSRGGACEG
jgi:hypothetical protein